MSSQRVRVEIDELVLHGFDARDRHAIGDAVAAELTRALAARPLAAAPRDTSRLDAGSVRIARAVPASTGAAIARAVHEGLLR